MNLGLQGLEFLAVCECRGDCGDGRGEIWLWVKKGSVGMSLGTLSPVLDGRCTITYARLTPPGRMVGTTSSIILSCRRCTWKSAAGSISIVDGSIA